MRYTRLIIIACVLCALIFPLQAFAAPTTFYGDVKGTIYNQAFRASGATVTLKHLDPVSGVETGDVASTTTDSTGNFKFDYVVFSSDQQFQYMIRADKGSSSAIAWVYALPPDNESQTYVAPINMDLSVPSRYTDATVTVWSTQARTTTNTNLGVVPRVKLTLYKLDGSNRTQIGTSYTTNNEGQYTFTGLPYGLYLARAESMSQIAEQQFAAYQQLVSVGIISNLPIPSPTPTPRPSATPGPGGNQTSTGGGFFGIPGFEAVAALIALLGAALYLRRA